MPWNFDYEIEVEIEQPTYEIEIEYDNGYHPGWHQQHQVDWNAGGGYHQEPQIEFEVEVEWDVGGWQNWGSRQNSNVQNWAVPWTGYYWQFGQKNQMNFQNFQIDLHGNIWGHGNDPVGNFNISGKMNNNGHFKFVKQYYGAHAVTYQGHGSNGHLAGQWFLPGQQPEKFQIRMNTPRWQGAYWQGGQRHQMVLDMSVTQYGVSGFGHDDVGSFNVRG